MRPPGRAIAAAPVLALALAATVAVAPARAQGCDLTQLVGYTLVQMKVIEGWIEDGRKQRGWEGCRPGRVLVFTDNTGVRCRGMALQKGQLPRAFLFARSETDIRLCVGDDLLDVAPAH